MKNSFFILILVTFFFMGFSYTSKVFSEEEIYIKVVENIQGSKIIKVYTPSSFNNLYMEIYAENDQILAGIHRDYYFLEKFNGKTKNTFIIDMDHLRDKAVSLTLFPGTEREETYKLKDLDMINLEKKPEVNPDKIRILKVMSYNIHHGKNKLGLYTLDRVMDTIKENKIDIVGLQEVDKGVYRSRFEDQVKLMAANLGMYYAFAPNISFMGMKYGNAILSKYPIDSFENIQLPGFKEKRGLLISKVNIENKELSFLVTHLGLTKSEREKQIKIIRDYIEYLDTKSILVGDFNSRHPVDEMNPIKDVMTDSSSGKRGRFKYTYEGLMVKSKIDYIFVSPEIKVLSYDVLDVNASDHYPVYAELIL